MKNENGSITTEQLYHDISVAFFSACTKDFFNPKLSKVKFPTPNESVKVQEFNAQLNENTEYRDALLDFPVKSFVQQSEIDEINNLTPILQKSLGPQRILRNLSDAINEHTPFDQKDMLGYFKQIGANNLMALTKLSTKTLRLGQDKKPNDPNSGIEPS